MRTNVSRTTSLKIKDYDLSNLRAKKILRKKNTEIYLGAVCQTEKISFSCILLFRLSNYFFLQ